MCFSKTAAAKIAVLENTIIELKSEIQSINKNNGILMSIMNNIINKISSDNKIISGVLIEVCEEFSQSKLKLSEEIRNCVSNNFELKNEISKINESNEYLMDTLHNLINPNGIHASCTDKIACMENKIDSVNSYIIKTENNTIEMSDKFLKMNKQIHVVSSLYINLHSKINGLSVGADTTNKINDEFNLTSKIIKDFIPISEKNTDHDERTDNMENDNNAPYSVQGHPTSPIPTIPDLMSIKFPEEDFKSMRKNFLNNINKANYQKHNQKYNNYISHLHCKCNPAAYYQQQYHTNKHFRDVKNQRIPLYNQHRPLYNQDNTYTYKIHPTVNPQFQNNMHKQSIF